MGELLKEIKNIVVDGRHAEIEENIQVAIDEGLDLNQIINDALIGAMDIVGKNFADNIIFVPEMLVSAMTMKKGLDIIKPLLKGEESGVKAKILLGTVKGDMHDIGKNLVAMMMEGAGFEVIDMGVDLSVEDVVGRVKTEKPDILGLSALLTTTLPGMKRVIDTLKEQGLRDTVKVIIGGAPVDKKFADSIGADGYGKDAAQAVELARKLVA